MSQSSQSILDHIAEMLQFISNTQSFWFTLDTIYNHGCHIANRFRLDPNDCKVASPLVALPWCRLVMPASCCIPSCHPLIAPPPCRPCLVASHQLVVASPLAILSLRCPLVIFLRQLSHCLSSSSCYATLLSTRRTSLLLHRLSLSSCCTPCCPLVLLSHRLIVALFLDVPPSRRLIDSRILTKTATPGDYCFLLM